MEEVRDWERLFVGEIRAGRDPRIKHAVEQFARHFKCRPDRLNQMHFRSYQAYLVRERKMDR